MHDRGAKCRAAPRIRRYRAWPGTCAAAVLAFPLALIVGFGPSSERTALQTAPSTDLHHALNKMLGLEAGEMFALERPAEHDGIVTTAVPIDETWFTLTLSPHSVRAPGYRLLVQRADGALEGVSPGPVDTVRGKLPDIAGSVAAGSWLDDGLHAKIILPDDRVYWIEPVGSRLANADPALHVIYRSTDVVATERWCSVGNGVPEHDLEPEAAANAGGTGPSARGALSVAELACDADYEYFLDYGSVSAVETRINSVINTVNLQYERDVAITHEITAIIVRTSEPDPYGATDPQTLLDQFRDHWLANRVYSGVPADLFGLQQVIAVGPMSGRSNVAWVLEHHAIEPTDDRIQRVLEKAKSTPRQLTDAEVLEAAR